MACITFPGVDAFISFCIVSCVELVHLPDTDPPA